MTDLDNELAALRRMARKCRRSRSPQIAAVRVRIKRRLRQRGASVPWNVPTQHLIQAAMAHHA